MYRYIVLLTTFFYTCLFSYAQDERWQVYPSYREAVQVETTENCVYAIMKGSGTRDCYSGNLIRYDLDDSSVKLYDSLHDLNDKEIFTISYNHSTRRLLVLYTNGNIDILCEDDIVYNISSLKDNSILGESVTCISHVGDYAYLCTSEHIIKVDFAECVIRQSYKVGADIRGLFDIGGTLYIALADGIYMLENEYELSNVSLWTKLCDLDVDKVVEFAGYLYVVTPKAKLYYVTLDGSKVDIVDSALSYTHIFVSRHKLICLNYGAWFAYFEYEHPLSPKVFTQDHNWQDVDFLQDRIYVVDKTGKLLYYTFDNQQKQFIPQVEESIIQINSPKRDFFYHIHYVGDRLLVAGGINAIVPAYYPVTFMYMEPDGKWVEFDETQVTKLDSRLNNVNAIALAQDPLDNRHFYGAVWRNGLHEYYMNENGYMELKKLNDKNNSPLQSIDVPVWDTWNYTTCTALQYDTKGNLWMANQHTDTIVRLIRPDGKWLGLYYPEIARTSNVFQYLFSSHNINFVVSYHGDKCGFFGFETNGTLNIADDDRRLLRSSITNQDGKTVVPAQFYCMAEDRDGQIWCGTNEGLFVVTYPQNWFDEDFNFHQIKRNRNDGSGFADYLLAGVTITSIAVDPSNRKWIGTLNDGLYLVSADGQETIYHFTKDNSPLLSNYIYSIAVNSRTGLVMIGTDTGLCSFDEKVTEPEDYLSGETLLIYPNPVRPSTNAVVTIEGLSDSADVKILSASGQVVWHSNSIGGSLRWDCCDMSGRQVSSGVYHVVCKSRDSNRKIVSRIVVLR